MAAVTRPKPTSKFIFGIVIKLYLCLFLALILVWGINLGWHIYDLYSLARNVQSDPHTIQSKNIISLVDRASSDVGTIYDELTPLFPIFNGLQKVPGVGQYLGQIEPLMTYGNGLTQAGKEIALGLAPLLDDTQPAGAGLSLPERASQVLAGGQAHFSSAAQYIDQAGSMRSRINPGILPEPAGTLLTRLDSKFFLLVAGVQFLQSAPRFLGDGSAQSYLILAQNRDELRATGGFISGIGMLTLQEGKITQFSLGDSYAVDDFSKAYPTPPEPLKRFMLSDYWVTRDANWSPDFPTAARQAQSLYTLSTGTETQAVIAFNQLVVKAVLGAIGPVHIPGTGEPVTADNVEEFMRQAWAPAPQQGPSDEWWLHRKDFMLQLGNVILEKVLGSSDQQQLLDLVQAIKHVLDQGQLLVYFDDPIAQQALQNAGWDGAIHPGKGDYLYLVDSNVGFNKVDSVINRSITYQVDLSDVNNPVAKVILTYQNSGAGNVPCKQIASYGSGTYQDLQLRCYWDYWRIYTPLGSVLLSANAQPVAAGALLNGKGWMGQVESLAGEGNSQVFAGLIVVPLSKTSQTEISYTLPLSILQTEENKRFVYSLSVQVQPGLAGLPFRLEVKLPGNAGFNRQAEGWESLSQNSWAWQSVIQQTVDLKVLFENNP